MKVRLSIVQPRSKLSKVIGGGVESFSLRNVIMRYRYFYCYTFLFVYLRRYCDPTVRCTYTTPFEHRTYAFVLFLLLLFFFVFYFESIRYNIYSP